MTDGPFAGSVINVKQHGAVGDGSADDTDALRAGIASSTEGQAIYFPPGTYLISKRLRPKPRQLYFSLGDAATIKVVPQTKPFPVFDVTSGPVKFHHLILDLSKPDDLEPPDCAKDALPGILAQAEDLGTVDLVVSSCRICHCHGQGIRVGGSGGPDPDRVIVRDSIVEDCCESGLTLNRVNGARVEASWFKGCRNGVQVASSRDVVVQAVTVTGNRRHGIVFRYSHDWHVSDCLASGNGGEEKDQDQLRGWGIVAGGGPEIKHPPPNSDFTITNNVCEDNYAGGITLDPTVADDPRTNQDESALIWAQRARVSGSVCRGRKDGEPRGGDDPFGVHGIHVRNSSDVVITDNHCYQNKHCGIAIVNSSHVLVQANACYENTTGIGLFAQDVPGAGSHVIGVNMLYENLEADLKGMS
jgi:parallel beta-helix repeat protein